MTDIRPTDAQKLGEAFKIGKDAGLRYVYIGNTMEEQNTYCYNCNELLIRRAGFSVLENKLKKSLVFQLIFYSIFLAGFNRVKDPVYGYLHIFSYFYSY